MLTLRPLTSFEPGTLRALGGKYTSSARYVVTKSESPERTLISIELATLPAPYAKQWDDSDAEEAARYQEYACQGYSLGAYEGDTLVAIALNEARWWNRTLWVWEFHVAPTCQRQGIGRTLMEAVFQMARQAGFRVVALETQSTNVPAISFYRAVGFELEGIDLSYYTNADIPDGEVAFFMKKKL